MRFGRGEKPVFEGLSPEAEHAQPKGMAGARRWRRSRAPVPPRPGGRLRRLCLRAAALCVVLACVALLALQFGLGSGEVARRAEAALRDAVEPQFSLAVGRSRAGWTEDRTLGLVFRDLALARPGGGETLAEVGRVAVSVAPMSLLAGAPQITGLSLSDMRLSLSHMQAAGGQGNAPPELTAAGLDAALSGLFAALRDADAALKRIGLNHVRLGNIELGALPGAGRPLQVIEAELAGVSGERTLTARLALGDVEFDATGQFSIDAATGKVSNLALDMTGAPVMIGALLADDTGQRGAPATLRIVAAEGDGLETHRFEIALTVERAIAHLGEAGPVPLSGMVRARLEGAAPKFEIEPSAVVVGRSSGTISGAILLPEQPGERIRYEIVSNDGVANPEDSPAPPTPFAARFSGTINPATKTLRVIEGALSNPGGNAYAQGALVWGGETPHAVFIVTVPDMDVEMAKAFWPAQAAPGARRWVLPNLVGGRISGGVIDIMEPLGPQKRPDGEPIHGQTTARFSISGTRFDVVGDIPPVREASGTVVHDERGITTITLDSGVAYLPTGREAEAGPGTLVIQRGDAQGLVMADLDLRVRGRADAIGEIISYRPIRAQRFRDYRPDDLSGDVDGRVKLRFSLNDRADTPDPVWSVALDARKLGIGFPIEGRKISDLTGSIEVDERRVIVDGKANIDGLPAELEITEPFGNSGVKPVRVVKLHLDDKSRGRIAPGLDEILAGRTSVEITGGGGEQRILADLSASTLALPWIGWNKGKGVDAQAVFSLVDKGSDTFVRDFDLKGGTFRASGELKLVGGDLHEARFSRVMLNKGDEVSVDIQRRKGGYRVEATGARFDARALIRRFIENAKSTRTAKGGEAIDVTARIAAVSGFGDVTLRDVALDLSSTGETLTGLKLTGKIGKAEVRVAIEGSGAKRRIDVKADDAGAVLRFLDIYNRMSGGTLVVSGTGNRAGGFSGDVELRRITITNEPRLKSLVSTGNNNSPSLREAVKKDIDTSRAFFDVAAARVVSGGGALEMRDGVVRGPVFGATFQGEAWDASGQMRMTGTFMPAYGLNRLFGEIPLLGLFLGNGRDRGLIGITFLLTGDADDPQVTVNPLSVIAPGVFRSIFEFRK